MLRAFPYSHSENSAEVRRELLDQCHCHPLSFSVVVAAVAGAEIELVACFVDSSLIPVLVLGTADASEAARADQWDPFVEVSSSLVVSAVAVVVVVVVVEIEVSGTVEGFLLVEVVLVLLVGTVVEVASSFEASVASDSEVALAEVVDLVAVVVVVVLEAVEVVLLLVLVLLRLLLLLMLRWSCGCPSVGGVEVLIVDSAGPSFAALVGQPSVDTVAVEEQGQLHQSVDHLRCLADMLHCWERVLCCTAERTTGDKHWVRSKGVVAVAVAGH